MTTDIPWWSNDILNISLSIISTVIGILSLVIGIWALVITYRSFYKIQSVDSKITQKKKLDLIIENLDTYLNAVNEAFQLLSVQDDSKALLHALNRCSQTLSELDSNSAFQYKSDKFDSLYQLQQAWNTAAKENQSYQALEFQHELAKIKTTLKLLRR